jgi:dolichyl-phosphate-mannose--protein O-mannosyl transferase
MEISPDTSLSSDTKNKISSLRNQSPMEIFMGLGLLLFISYFLFLKGYQNPDKLFWDENYHIASAQKYLDKTFFLEQHPPLGKLLIALGEHIVQPNEKLDRKYFNRQDHLKKVPKGYSFTGMRLVPVLCLIGSGLLFFLILYHISRSLFLSLTFSSLFMFDNASIVQSRAAHLEPIQFIFLFAAILLGLRMLDSVSPKPHRWALLGLFIGLAAAVKVTSFILLLLFPFLYLKTILGPYPSEATSEGVASGKLKFSSCIGNLWKPMAGIAMSLIALSAIYYVHFRLARNVVNKRFYLANTELRKDLKEDNTSFSAFATFMKETIRYTDRFNDGVPRLRPDGPKENGSHPVFWPLGKKSISYRWDKTKDGKIRHHRIHCNPVGWAISFISLLLCTSLIAAHRVFDLAVSDSNRRTYGLIEIFAAMWWAYMIVMMGLGRVMYLYHYLVPLFFGCILSLLLYLYLFSGLHKKRKVILYSSVLLFTLAQAIAFWYFSPFTYHLPITPNEFWQRQWTTLWRYELILW